MRISKQWKFIFRHVPGALFFFRMLVFLFLESTAIRFNTAGNGPRARDQSAERAEAQNSIPDVEALGNDVIDSIPTHGEIVETMPNVCGLGLAPFTSMPRPLRSQA